MIKKVLHLEVSWNNNKKVMIPLEHNNKRKEEYVSIYLIHIILKKDKNNNKDFLIDFCFLLFVSNFMN